jgi:hypothetical protein
VKRLSRRPGEIETLNFHAAVDLPALGEQRLVSDPARVDATVALFAAGLRDSLGTPSRIRGWISDQLFGLIAADLGGCVLVKQEDSGVLFYGAEAKLPDWRLTLVSGDNILVEVKAVDDDLPRVAKLRLSEVGRLRRYADLNGCPLHVALHWVALDLWTLVAIDSFIRVDDHLEIDLPTAAKIDQMGSLLDDRLLGLVPPLEFRMTMKGDLSETAAAESGDGTGTTASQISAVITDVQMFCGGEEMVDEREKALVWFLIQHARWPVEEYIQQVGDGMFDMVFAMAPEEEVEGQGFSIIGRLSELYTRMFYAGTSIEEGTTKLNIDIEPGTLPRLVPTDMQSERLPLWHIRVQPNLSDPR